MHFTVREFGYIGVTGEPRGLDYIVLSEKSFAQLKQLASAQKEGEAELLSYRLKSGQECFQVLNYVGLLQTPDGCQIEVLPKTTN